MHDDVQNRKERTIAYTHSKGLAVSTTSSDALDAYERGAVGLHPDKSALWRSPTGVTRHGLIVEAI